MTSSGPSQQPPDQPENQGQKALKRLARGARQLLFAVSLQAYREIRQGSEKKIRQKIEDNEKSRDLIKLLEQDIEKLGVYEKLNNLVKEFKEDMDKTKEDMDRTKNYLDKTKEDMDKTKEDMDKTKEDMDKAEKDLQERITEAMRYQVSKY